MLTICLILLFYPKATSNTIIKTNPAISPRVDKFLFSFTDSGNNSLATTIIIAPAANASKNGSKLLIYITSTAPIIAAIGSTSADACPIIKLLNLEYPSLLNGRDTAAPSGKFCIPIPSASINAPIAVTPGILLVIPPNATPIAKPSGILWIVIAETKSITLFNEFEFLRLFLFFKALSKNLSDINTKNPPIIKPIAGSTQAM